MSINLMAKRYKVIAPYPHDRMHVGRIFTVGEMGVETQIGWQNYPHLFKELAWHDERAIEDMPEYVKHKGGWVNKVSKHFSSSWDEYTKYGCKISESFYSYRHLSPATKQEYEQYLNNKA